MSAEDIFHKAITKKSHGEREAFLHEACGMDEALRKKVDALIEAHNEAGSFLEQPVYKDRLTEAQAGIIETESSKIGPYKLLQQIGEGGFGIVFICLQSAERSR